LRRAFYRLLAISPQDDAVTEHESEAEETVNYFIQHGLWNAQYWLLTNTSLRKWIQEVGPITWLTDSTTGDRYVELPDDFIRLAGDDNNTAFFYRTSSQAQRRLPWGNEMDQRDKLNYSGAGYYIENDRIVLARRADVSSGRNLYYDYYYRHAVLDEEETIDFPVDIRPLIVAEAAAMALSESWLPFEDIESENKILRNLAYWRNVASSKARRSRTPQKLRGRNVPSNYGTNWMR
jgi:hypothetical protein